MASNNADCSSLDNCVRKWNECLIELSQIESFWFSIRKCRALIGFTLLQSLALKVESYFLIFFLRFSSKFYCFKIVSDIINFLNFCKHVASIQLHYLRILLTLANLKPDMFKFTVFKKSDSSIKF